MPQVADARAHALAPHVEVRGAVVNRRDDRFEAQAADDHAVAGRDMADGGWRMAAESGDWSRAGALAGEDPFGDRVDGRAGVAARAFRSRPSTTRRGKRCAIAAAFEPSAASMTSSISLRA